MFLPDTPLLATVLRPTVLRPMALPPTVLLPMALRPTQFRPTLPDMVLQPMVLRSMALQAMARLMVLHPITLLRATTTRPILLNMAMAALETSATAPFLMAQVKARTLPRSPLPTTHIRVFQPLIPRPRLLLMILAARTLNHTRFRPRTLTPLSKPGALQPPRRMSTLQLLTAQLLTLPSLRSPRKLRTGRPLQPLLDPTLLLNSQLRSSCRLRIAPDVLMDMFAFSYSSFKHASTVSSLRSSCS